MKKEEDILQSELIALIERIKMLVADGNFKKASKYIDEVIKKDRYNGKAYYYMLLTEFECKNSVDLSNLTITIWESNTYKKAYEYGDSDQKRNLTTIKNDIYQKIKNDNDRVISEEFQRFIDSRDIDGALEYATVKRKNEEKWE